MAGWGARARTGGGPGRTAARSQGAAARHLLPGEPVEPLGAGAGSVVQPPLRQPSVEQDKAITPPCAAGARSFGGPCARIEGTPPRCGAHRRGRRRAADPSPDDGPALVGRSWSSAVGRYGGQLRLQIGGDAAEVAGSGRADAPDEGFDVLGREDDPRAERSAEGDLDQRESARQRPDPDVPLARRLVEARGEQFPSEGPLDALAVPRSIMVTARQSSGAYTRSVATKAASSPGRSSRPVTRRSTGSPSQGTVMGSASLPRLGRGGPEVCPGAEGAGSLPQMRQRCSGTCHVLPCKRFRNAGTPRILARPRTSLRPAPGQDVSTPVDRSPSSATPATIR